MPENKKSSKNAGTRPTAKKTTTTSKNTKPKSTPKSEPKKSRTAPVERENTVLRQIAPYILAAAAVLIGVCVIFGEGSVG